MAIAKSQAALNKSAAIGVKLTIPGSHLRRASFQQEIHDFRSYHAAAELAREAGTGAVLE